MNERRGDNFFDKPNEQSETCFDFAMAGKNRRRQRLKEGVSKHLDFSSTMDFADLTDLQIADYQQ